MSGDKVLLPNSVVDRFWRNVIKSDDGSCWGWSGTINKSGYAQISNGYTQSLLCHRVSYKIYHGAEIPSGMFVCHKCDNRSCCNPDHLFLGTPKDNSVDAVKKGRMQRGDRRWNSKIKHSDIAEIFKMRNAGAKLSEIASRFSVTDQAVSLVLRRKNWAWVNTGPCAVEP